MAQIEIKNRKGKSLAKTGYITEDKMAKRKWIAKWSMGYVGTDTEEEIDLIDDWGYSEEQLAGMTDEEANAEVANYAHEQALEMIEAYAEEGEE